MNSKPGSPSARAGLVSKPRPWTHAFSIVGAGLAGMAAALAIRERGGDVSLYERGADVGERFHGDFQGLENWTTSVDAVEELAGLGIAPGYGWSPFREVTCFAPSGTERRFRAERPLFYLARRGSGPGSLDQAMKAAVTAAGAEIQFNVRMQHLPHGGVAAEGPHRADVIAAGYVFDTELADGAYVALSDRLAPKGYAYLLVHDHRATLATCMFSDFHKEHWYLERTVAFFRDRVGADPARGARFGGAGNFNRVSWRSLRRGRVYFAGETAGFQDPLFGFGMRYALLSGYAAGCALVDGRVRDYRRLCARLPKSVDAGMVNRAIYERLRDQGYESVLGRWVPPGDVGAWMRRLYAPVWWKRWIAPLAYRSRRSTQETVQEGCDCTWCRCARPGNPGGVDTGTGFHRA